MVVDAIANMKVKIIQDFDSYLKRASYWYYDDYSYILHKIAFIQSFSSIDNIDSIYGFLINK